MTDPADPTPPPAPEGVSGKRVVLVLGVMAAALLLAMAIAPVVIQRTTLARRQATQAGCASQLRALGLAAIQYAGDQRAFPHIRAAAALDGGPDTADTPRAWRLLVANGYLDDPWLLVCPARPRLRKKARKHQERYFEWLKGKQDAAKAPSLEWFEHLSYGWTRRALTPSAAGSTPLAADKAAIPRGGNEPRMKGNHTNGWNVLRRSGAVEWLDITRDPFPGAWLGRAEDPNRDGFLSIELQANPRAFR